MTAAAMTAAAVTVAVAAELTAVAATTKAVRTAPTMAAIVVAAVTVTATAVCNKDIGSNSDGRGHRQQSTIIGSKNMVAVATAMETAPAGTAMSPGHWRRQNCLCHCLGRLWVLVVMVVCGVVRAGCVCAARPCCFVRLTGIMHQKIGKPRHIGDRRKGLNETNQFITFN